MAAGENELQSVIVLYSLAIYAAVGIVAAVAFVSWGVSKVLAEPTTLTLGARLLLLPGAFLLWPYVVVRWLTSGCAARSHAHVHPRQSA